MSEREFCLCPGENIEYFGTDSKPNLFVVHYSNIVIGQKQDSTSNLGGGSRVQEKEMPVSCLMVRLEDGPELWLPRSYTDNAGNTKYLKDPLVVRYKDSESGKIREYEIASPEAGEELASEIAEATPEEYEKIYDGLPKLLEELEGFILPDDHPPGVDEKLPKLVFVLASINSWRLSCDIPPRLPRGVEIFKIQEGLDPEPFNVNELDMEGFAKCLCYVCSVRWFLKDNPECQSDFEVNADEASIQLRVRATRPI